MKKAEGDLVDITSEPPSRVPGAAFHAVRDLRPGQCVVLLTSEEPSLLMRSLDLQAGHKLVWSFWEEVGRWRTVVRRRADAAPTEVLDLLRREHAEIAGQAMRARPGASALRAHG